MNERQFYVRAISQRRRAEWDRIFGSEELPVRSCQPAPTPAGCLAYRLDENRLHWMQRERLVHWLAKRYGMTGQDARWTMADGLPIPSADAALVHEFEREQATSPAPAFVLSGRCCTPAWGCAKIIVSHSQRIVISYAWINQYNLIRSRVIFMIKSAPPYPLGRVTI